MSKHPTSVENIRRKGWHRFSFPDGSHEFRRSFPRPELTRCVGPYFTMDVYNIAGWRYFLLNCRRDLLCRSEAFATDILAVLAGIAHTEMLIADPIWVAAACEAEAEDIVALIASREAARIENDRRRAQELHRQQREHTDDQ